MTDARVFDPAHLAALARPARTRLADAAAGGDRDEVEATLRTIARAFRQNARSFDTWARLSAELLDGMELAGAPHRDVTAAWRIGAFSGVRVDDAEHTVAAHHDELMELHARAGSAALVERYVEIEGSVRRLHAARCDWVSWLWSLVYRTGGPDALEACLRDLADQTLLRWMAVDVETPIAERVVVWADSMMGNFATFRIEELPDRIRFVQDPCGTCSSRVDAGAYAPPLDLAIVTEPHPVTLGRGGVPVYRTHVAVMHWMVPPERLGTPWPRVHCPAGAATGPCRIELMKDPFAPPDGEAVALVEAARSRPLP